MKKLLLCLLLANVIHLHADNINNPNNENCSEPLEYIMYFLKKSSTVYKGSLDSKNWKNLFLSSEKLSELHEKKKIKTSYVGAHLNSYCTLIKQFFGTNEALNVKSQFVIESIQDDAVQITSTIRNEGLIPIQTQEQVNNLPELLTEVSWLGVSSGIIARIEQKDSYTNCEHVLDLQGGKNNNLHLTLESKCTCNVPLAIFKAYMEEKNQNLTNNKE